jgi:RNA polymerase sigma-70 factor (family 1)
VVASHIHSDRALFMQMSAGDEKAFRAIFELYKVELFRAAIRLTKSRVIAEEIIQEVFIGLWISREHLTKVEDPASYIYRILFNRTSNYLRKEANQQRIIKAAMQHTQSSSDSTEQLVDVNETEHLIEQALGQLPPRQKIVYKLRCQQGLSNDEIASQLHVSQHTIKSHLSKAIGFIRTYLGNTSIVVALLANLGNLVLY